MVLDEGVHEILLLRRVDEVVEVGVVVDHGAHVVDVEVEPELVLEAEALEQGRQEDEVRWSASS